MKPALYSLGHSFVVVALATASFASSAAAQATTEQPLQGVALTRVIPGKGIPAALGPRMSELAKRHGKTEAEMKSLCETNASLRMDREGRLHFSCGGLLPLQGAIAEATTASGGTSTVSSIPLDQTFLLHSKPGSNRVIYLDFNGHTTSGTPWNSNFTSGASIVTPAYDTDGIPASFSTTELQNIQNIWRIVSEDYAPFDVDVTTVDPGLEALRKTTSSDAAYGVRVCIGGSSTDWYGAGAGGVAYIGSFSWSTDSPAFVFPAQLGNGNSKYTGEAVSHEIGHTFGLYHDGQTNITEYYQGHNGWAPIMGVGYYQATSQWSKGEYTSANNLEDDIAIITQNAPIRGDLHGDSVVNATLMPTNSFSVLGLIERRTDADLFGFNCGAGTLSFTSSVSSPSPNLNTQLSLYDSLGNFVTSVDGTGMSATLTATVAQGTYFIAVDGVGTDSPTVGFNDYGSLGEFQLTGTAPPVSGTPPVAVADNSAPLTGTAPLTVQFSSNGSYDPDGTITAFDWDFGNGSVSTAGWPSQTYTTPGTYTASLVVRDNSGLTGSDTVTVIVSPAPANVYVSNIAMTKSTSSRGTVATAVVTVKNQSGAIVSGAKVTGTWSGLATGTSTKSTNTAGSATFASSRVRGTGLFTFTVTGITISGYTYQPGLNVETRDSISVP